MEVKELQQLKEKIEKAKSEKAKAEGSLEQIQKRWKDDFDCTSVDQVEAKIKETEEQIKSLTEKKDNYIKEIEEVMEGVDG